MASPLIDRVYGRRPPVPPPDDEVAGQTPGYVPPLAPPSIDGRPDPMAPPQDAQTPGVVPPMNAFTPNVEGGGEGLEPMIPGGLPPGGGVGDVGDPGSPPQYDPGGDGPIINDDPLPTYPQKKLDVPWEPGGKELDDPIDPTLDPPGLPVIPGGGDKGDLGKSIADKLKELFGQSINPDMNDPQLASARLNNQRTFERGRQLAAERAGVEGTNNSGGFDTMLLGLNQDRGQADLGALAGLGKDRQANILQALQLASGNQNANNQLGFNYAELLAFLNSQGLGDLLSGGGV